MLALGVEEALLLEAALDLLKGELEGPGAHGLKLLGDELDLAALLVNGDASAKQDLEAVFRAEAKQRGLTPEEDG